jgi:hypothetical protein
MVKCGDVLVKMGAGWEGRWPRWCRMRLSCQKVQDGKVLARWCRKEVQAKLLQGEEVLAEIEQGGGRC